MFNFKQVFVYERIIVFGITITQRIEFFLPLQLDLSYFPLKNSALSITILFIPHSGV